MSQGYTRRLYQQNLGCDINRLGVKLGRLCIAADIPVTEVAAKFNVSRATVYNWFNGDTDPHKSLEDAIEDYLTEVTDRV
jgi:transcriptional regulator with XRE-family HTH domain